MMGGDGWVDEVATQATKTRQRAVRKLAAILVADVVGYSRLAGVDEREAVKHATVQCAMVDD